MSKTDSTLTTSDPAPAAAHPPVDPVAQHLWDTIRAVRPRVLAALGPGMQAGPTYHSVHPRFIEFFQQRPSGPFTGFSDKPLLATRAELDMYGSTYHLRIERIEVEGIGSCLVVTWMVERNNKPRHIHGTLLPAAPGSAEERAFIDRVMADQFKRLSWPIRAFVREARAAGYELSSEEFDDLREWLHEN